MNKIRVRPSSLSASSLAVGGALSSQILALSLLGTTLLGGCTPLTTTTGEGEGEVVGEGEGEGDPCSGIDNVLGDAVVESGFAVTTSVVLADDVLAIGCGDDSDGGVSCSGVRNDENLSMVFLGKWPLANRAEGNVVTTLVNQFTPTGSRFLSPFVARGTDRAMAGFTTTDSGAVTSGRDSGGGGGLLAPGNFSALRLGSFWLVDGLGLQTLTGLGVYGWDESADPLLVATFPAEAIASGFSTVTRNGVVLLGAFTSENVLYSVPADGLGNVLTGGAGPVALSDVVAHGADINDVTTFGNGIAVTRVDANFRKIAVDRTGIDNSGVSLVIDAAPAPVLSLHGTCTQILATTQLGDHLGVLLQDLHGQRLVELQRQ